jgi:hypothetical protein
MIINKMIVISFFVLVAPLVASLQEQPYYDLVLLLHHATDNVERIVVCCVSYDADDDLGFQEEGVDAKPFLLPEGITFDELEQNSVSCLVYSKKQMITQMPFVAVGVEPLVFPVLLPDFCQMVYLMLLKGYAWSCTKALIVPHEVVIEKLHEREYTTASACTQTQTWEQKPEFTLFEREDETGKTLRTYVLSMHYMIQHGGESDEMPIQESIESPSALSKFFNKIRTIFTSMKDYMRGKIQQVLDE